MVNSGGTQKASIKCRSIGYIENLKYDYQSFKKNHELYVFLNFTTGNKLNKEIYVCTYPEISKQDDRGKHVHVSVSIQKY